MFKSVYSFNNNSSFFIKKNVFTPIKIKKNLGILNRLYKCICHYSVIISMHQKSEFRV